jgi:Tfp pilus assembly protein PilO
MRFIMPAILTGIAITFFFVVTNPLYNTISGLKTQLDSYNQALTISTQLKNERDQLTATENNINPDDLAKLQKLLPDNVNNIRLVLEVEQIAAAYGMQLSSVSYDTTDDSSAPAAGTDTAAVQDSSTGTASGDYGTFNLGFSTSGTYDNFISFTQDLESNLRIVDVSSIAFSSDTNAPASNTTTPPAGIYKYTFSIKTYWLKS